MGRTEAARVASQTPLNPDAARLDIYLHTVKLPNSSLVNHFEVMAVSETVLDQRSATALAKELSRSFAGDVLIAG